MNHRSSDLPLGPQDIGDSRKLSVLKETAARQICEQSKPLLVALGAILIGYELLGSLLVGPNKLVITVNNIIFGLIMLLFPTWCAGMPGHHWRRLVAIIFLVLINSAIGDRAYADGPSEVPTSTCFLVLGVALLARSRREALAFSLAGGLIVLAVTTPWQVGPKAFAMSILDLGLAAAAGYLVGSMLHQLRLSELASRHVLWTESRYDTLSGLGNRRYFEECAAREEMASRDHALSYSILMIDIDHFKAVNDAHGHAIGDLVIQELGRRIRSQARTTDISARLGGEEFVILCPNAKAGDAETCGFRIHRAIAERPVSISAGQTITVTVSVGISLSKPGEPMKHVMEKADQALYQAKNAGRNRIVTFGG